MPKFSVTYAIATPESVAAGDYAEHGFICENVGLREAMRAMSGHANESSSYPMQPGDWFTYYEYDHDYRTGAVESRSLHLPRNTTMASTRRIARLLGVRIK